MSQVYHTEPQTYGKVVLNTSYGDIDVELWPKECPKACRNFIQLALDGYYDNTIFHRVIKNFMIQGGDPTGTGQGGESIWGKGFKDEVHSRLLFNHRGQVAMANEQNPNTNHSQFFITLDASPWLNKKHTIFGKVTGNTIFNALRMGECDIGDNDRPIDPPKLIGVEVLMNPFDDVVSRVTSQSAEAKKAEEAKAEAAAELKKRRKKQGKKDFKVLSFGDEALAEEEELVSMGVTGGVASAHDVLNDEKLSKEKAYELEGGEEEEADRRPKRDKGEGVGGGGGDDKRVKEKKEKGSKKLKDDEGGAEDGSEGGKAVKRRDKGDVNSGDDDDGDDDGGRGDDDGGAGEGKRKGKPSSDKGGGVRDTGPAQDEESRALMERMRAEMMKKKRRLEGSGGGGGGGKKGKENEEEDGEEEKERKRQKKEKEQAEADKLKRRAAKEKAAEHEEMRQQMRTKNRAAKVMTGEDRVKYDTEQATVGMMTPLEQMKAKYKQRKAAHGSREQDTLAKLASFKSKIRTSDNKKEEAGSSSGGGGGDDDGGDEVGGASAVEKGGGRKEEEEGYHGQVTEGDLYEGDEDDADWFAGRLKFKRHIDDKARMGLGSDGRQSDDYVVLDDRKTNGYGAASNSGGGGGGRGGGGGGYGGGAGMGRGMANERRAKGKERAGDKKEKW